MGKSKWLLLGATVILVGCSANVGENPTTINTTTVSKEEPKPEPKLDEPAIREESTEVEDSNDSKEDSATKDEDVANKYTEASKEERQLFIAELKSLGDLDGKTLTAEGLIIIEPKTDEAKGYLNEDELHRQYIKEGSQYKSKAQKSVIKDKGDIQESVDEKIVINGKYNVVRQVFDVKNSKFYGDLEQLIESNKLYLDPELSEELLLIFDGDLEENIKKAESKYKGKYGESGYAKDADLLTGYEDSYRVLGEYLEANDDVDVYKDEDTLFIELDTDQYSEVTELMQTNPEVYYPLGSIGGSTLKLMWEIDSNRYVSDVVLLDNEDIYNQLELNMTVEDTEGDLALPEADDVLGTIGDLNKELQKDLGYYDNLTIAWRSNILDYTKADEETRSEMESNMRQFLVYSSNANNGDLPVLEEDVVRATVEELVSDKELKERLTKLIDEVFSTVVNVEETTIEPKVD